MGQFYSDQSRDPPAPRQSRAPTAPKPRATTTRTNFNAAPRVLSAPVPPAFLAMPLGTHIRTVPVEIFRIISEWLSSDDLALLYATFDRRLQNLVRLARVDKTAVIAPLNMPQHWHVLYYLTSIGEIKAVVLQKHANVSTRGLTALAALLPDSISLDTYAISAYDQPDAPFSYSSIRNDEKPSDAIKNARTFSMDRFSLSHYFPSLKALYLQSPLVSILSSKIMAEYAPKTAEECGLIDFFSKLPLSLQTLHCANASLIASLNMNTLFHTVPASLTDVRIAGKSSVYVCLAPIVSALPSVRILHLNLTYKGHPALWRAHDNPFRLPETLSELKLLLHSSSLMLLENPMAFPFKDSCLAMLSIEAEVISAAKWASQNLRLRDLLPLTLIDLRLSDALIRVGSEKHLVIENFACNLVSLQLGKTLVDSSLLAKLSVLTSLQYFSAHPHPKPVHKPNWSLFPRSITSLELTEYSMSEEEIVQLPETLLRLKCHVQLLKEVLAIVSRCPDCFFTCDLEMYLVPFNMTCLLQFGLDSVERLTTWNILEHIRNYIGSRCEIQFAFCPASLLRIFSPLDSLTLAPKNTAIVLETGTTRVRSLSLVNSTFDPILVKIHQQLTLLEFQSKSEISSLRFCPPNLTSLNLRKSPIKNGIILKDMPKSLTSFTAQFRTEAYARADFLPATKQLVHLDAPWLMFSPDDIKNGCSVDLYTIRCSLSSVSDVEVQKMIDSWTLASSVSLNVLARITGHLSDFSRTTVNYEVLKSDSSASLQRVRGVERIELLPPMKVFVAPGVDSIELLWPEPVPSCLSGFENALLPESLTKLEVFLCRDIKSLWAQLPPSLLTLRVECTDQASEFIGPFPPNLQSLALICQRQRKRGLMVGFTLFHLPQSLETLQLSLCTLSVVDHAMVGRPNLPNLLYIEISALESEVMQEIFRRLVPRANVEFGV